MALLNVIKAGKRKGRINDDLDLLEDRYRRNLTSNDPETAQAGGIFRTPSRLNVVQKNGYVVSYVVVGSDGQ